MQRYAEYFLEGVVIVSPLLILVAFIIIRWGLKKSERKGVRKQDSESYDNPGNMPVIKQKTGF